MLASHLSSSLDGNQQLLFKCSDDFLLVRASFRVAHFPKCLCHCQMSACFSFPEEGMCQLCSFLSRQGRHSPRMQKPCRPQPCSLVAGITGYKVMGREGEGRGGKVTVGGWEKVATGDTSKESVWEPSSSPSALVPEGPPQPFDLLAGFLLPIPIANTTTLVQALIISHLLQYLLDYVH